MFSLNYLFIGTGFILNIVILFVKENPLTFILYLTALYLVIFSPTLPLVFVKKLLNVNPNAKSKKDILFTFFFGFLVFLILSIPEGITINHLMYSGIAKNL